MNDKLNMVALVALSVLACGTLVGMVVLEMANKPIPPSLIAIGATCIGTLSGFLNPNRATVRVEPPRVIAGEPIGKTSVVVSELRK